MTGILFILEVVLSEVLHWLSLKRQPSVLKEELLMMILVSGKMSTLIFYQGSLDSLKNKMQCRGFNWRMREEKRVITAHGRAANIYNHLKRPGKHWRRVLSLLKRVTRHR